LRFSFARIDGLYEAAVPRPRFADTTATWIQLLRENRALKGDYHFSRGYNNAAVRAQAVLAGQGIGLVSYTVVYQDILSGALKKIACRSAPFDQGYRFLFNRRKAGMPKIERFRQWLVEEMQQMQRVIDGEGSA
jgi:LysR family glycine cleavage system transcriptional activator